MIDWVRVSKSANAPGDYPIQQVEYKGKVADAVVIFPYGMYANIAADTLALKVHAQGDAENRAVIGCVPPDRPALNEGEIAIYHPGSGAVIKLTSAGVTIEASSITLDGDVAITGDLTVGPLAKDFLTHVHAGSPTAPTGPVTPTGVLV